MKIFLAGGESRHWLNFPLLESIDENILAGEYYSNMANAIKQIAGVGIVPDEVKNANIPCRSIDGRQLEETRENLLPERGGYG